jgi:predicted metal-dependent hydrolase
MSIPTIRTIELGDIAVNVVQKNIKNVHLSVYPPSGQVRISAPLRMNLESIRLFAISKLGWIKKQQKKIRSQERETPREYIDRESHYLWGKRYLLNIIEKDAPPHLEIQHSQILLQVPPGANLPQKQTLVDDFYRQQLNVVTPPLIAQWEQVMGVQVTNYAIRKMKTRWGSCSPHSQKIRLNLELAKKPIDCLEYVLVHEMAHLLEPSHNQRFIAVLDRFMPKWRFYQAELNRLPLSDGNQSK